MKKELTANTTISHYRIVSKIGAGGMGEVYLAQDTKLDRKVALKILPTDVAADEQRMRRFVLEAKTVSALNHPNIITIHEIEESGSTHFIATEFIDGETLRHRLQSAPLKLSEVLDVATQIASALSAAHTAGIVHRDIKPENTMLRRDGIVKVLDFGLAKLTERLPPDSVDTEASTSFKTDPGSVIGTVSYMSPEQARALPVDARTDIFSLGVVVYEMVAGCLPFAGSTPSEVLAAILSEKEPQPLARYSREVPAELERIVSKALRKAPEQRYQTIKDLKLDLQSLKQQLEFEAKLERSMPPSQSGTPEYSAGTAPVNIARPTASVQYVVNEINRHKTGAGLALAALVIALALAGYFYFLRGSKAAIDSIAVLPFTNVNGDPNAEYLSDGITESIIGSLSQLTHLRVMARSTVFRYKGRDVDPQKVGHDLGVRAVLMGRVIQQADNLTIRTELVNVADGTELWGQQYNRKLADVFAVQEEIAKEISEKLRLKLTGAEREQLAKRPTENLIAFQHYMQGRVYAQRRTREDLLTAIGYYEKAINEDSNYPLAYAGLSDAYANLAVRSYIAPVEGRRKTEEAARKALALDENLAEAHAALGYVYILFAPFNFSLGDRELRRAIQLSPSLAFAHQYLGNSLLRQGRLDEGLEEYLKARELDPLSPIIARGVGLCYYLKRDYVQALDCFGGPINWARILAYPGK
jgi:serine/threonine-protein kinase